MKPRKKSYDDRRGYICYYENAIYSYGEDL